MNRTTTPAFFARLIYLLIVAYIISIKNLVIKRNVLITEGSHMVSQFIIQDSSVFEQIFLISQPAKSVQFVKETF